MAHDEQDQASRELMKELDMTGWGLFFVWVGLAFFAEVGWGIGLLGVGVIGLAMQAVRRYCGVRVDRFGLAVGILFALAGAWKLLELQVGEAGLHSLMPGVSVVVGVLLLLSALRHKRKH